MLILIEGVDGMGKTTLVSNLQSFMDEHKYSYRIIKYPTTYFRKILSKSIGFKSINALIFCIDFLIHKFNSNISKSINDPHTYVLMDRYWISTLCYQLGNGRPTWLIKTLIRLCNTIFYSPDVVIWLDTNLDIAMDRLRITSDTTPFDSHMETYHNLKLVRDNYISIFPYINNCYRIEASQSSTQVLNDALSIINVPH